MSEVSVTFEPEKVSVEALAHLGEGHIAYVKQVRSEDVPGLFPQAPKIAPGLKLFALHAADGTPIMLTDSREAALDDYLKLHPQLGIPKPGVAEKWNDPAYAEAVICARENRLTAEQIREIRYLAAIGMETDQIRLKVGALNDGQVRHVIDGRTYARIR